MFTCCRKRVKHNCRRVMEEDLIRKSWKQDMIFFVVNGCLLILNLSVTYIKECDLSTFVVLLLDYDLTLFCYQ